MESQGDLWGDPCARFERGTELPDVATLTPGFRGGHWSRFPRSPAYRFFGPRVLACDFRDSPVVDRQGSLQEILEDHAGNLWFDTGNYFGIRSIFVKRMNTLEIRASELPTRARRSLTLTCEVTFAGAPLSDAPLFWRLDGGPWHGGEERDVRLEFPGSGTFAAEVVALGPLGGVTPEPLRWTIHVEAPLPDTVATSDGPYVCDDLRWKIPAQAVPSEPGAEARIFVRVDEGEWEPAYRGTAVLFAGLEDGEHDVRVAAVEGEQYHDPSPLHFRVSFEPDYAAIVSRRLDRLSELGPADAQAALFELSAAGAGVLPLLRERLEAAREAARQEALLEALIDKF